MNIQDLIAIAKQKTINELFDKTLRHLSISEWLQLMTSLKEKTLTVKEQVAFKKHLLTSDEENRIVLIWKAVYSAENPDWTAQFLTFLETCIQQQLLTKNELKKSIDFTLDLYLDSFIHNLAKCNSPDCLQLWLDFLTQLWSKEELSQLWMWSIGEGNKCYVPQNNCSLDTLLPMFSSPDCSKIFFAWLMKQLSPEIFWRAINGTSSSGDYGNITSWLSILIHLADNEELLSRWLQLVEHYVLSYDLKQFLLSKNRLYEVVDYEDLDVKFWQIWCQWLEKYFSKEELQKYLIWKIDEENSPLLIHIISIFNESEDTIKLQKWLQKILPIDVIKMTIEQYLDILIRRFIDWEWHNSHIYHRLPVMLNFLAIYLDSKKISEAILAKNQNGNFVLSASIAESIVYLENNRDDVRDDYSKLSQIMQFLMIFIEYDAMHSLGTVKVLRDLLLEKCFFNQPFVLTLMKYRNFYDVFSPEYLRDPYFKIYLKYKFLQTILEHKILDQELLVTLLQNEQVITDLAEKDNAICANYLSILPLLNIKNRQILLNLWKKPLKELFLIQRYELFKKITPEVLSVIFHLAFVLPETGLQLKNFLFSFEDLKLEIYSKNQELTSSELEVRASQLQNKYYEKCCEKNPNLQWLFDQASDKNPIISNVENIGIHWLNNRNVNNDCELYHIGINFNVARLAIQFLQQAKVLRGFKKNRERVFPSLSFFFSGQIKNLRTNASLLINQLEGRWLPQEMSSTFGIYVLSSEKEQLIVQWHQQQNQDQSLIDRIWKLMDFLLNGNENDIGHAYSFLSKLCRPNDDDEKRTLNLVPKPSWPLYVSLYVGERNIHKFFDKWEKQIMDSRQLSVEDENPFKKTKFF